MLQFTGFPRSVGSSSDLLVVDPDDGGAEVEEEFDSWSSLHT